MNSIYALRRIAWMPLLLLSMLTQSAVAQQEQKITVKSFRQDRQAQTARSSTYSRTDSDGNLYAIVKVKSNSGDNLLAYTFSFGLLTHVVDSVHDDGALWIYVKKNAKYLTIKRQGYISVTNYDLGDGLEEGCTYELRISAQAEAVKKRYLMFEVIPPDVQAVIKVKREGAEGDYTIWGRVDASGRKSQLIETGVWLYEVTAANYQPSTGRVVLTEGNGMERERVALLPAFGFLEVDNPAGITEAEIYVDDNFIGTTPYQSDTHWNIGSHRIVVKKGELYSDYINDFTIESGKTTRLTPELKANFAQTTIVVDADADIYIDGERVGSRTWSGPRKAGTYTVECRQEKHRTSTRQITVRQGVSETFRMDPPKPITGMLYVNTDPVGATVTIDGKQEGSTPFDQQLPVGQHTVLLSKNGYEQVSRTVDIDDGAEEVLDITMQQIITPKKKAKKKDPAKKNQSSFGGFAEADLQVGSLMGLELGAGICISNFCVEAFYILGLSKSETVYWTKGTETVEAIYKPSAMGLRLGYAIDMGKLNLIPQIGARAVSIKSEAGNSKGNATAATISLRADYHLAKSVSLFAAPDMAFAMSKSDVYSQLYDVSPKIKGWVTGFNARLGICVKF